MNPFLRGTDTPVAACVTLSGGGLSVTGMALATGSETRLPRDLPAASAVPLTNPAASLWKSIMSLLWPIGILLFAAATLGMLVYWRRHRSSRTSYPERSKQVRVEATRDALLVSFNSPRIHSEAELHEIGTTLMQLVDQAANLKTPLLLSFRGVLSISSALIGKLVLVNKRARELRVKFQMVDLSPPVAEVFRIIGPGPELGR